jgi:DNA-binding NtrC family response regulator
MPAAESATRRPLSLHKALHLFKRRLVLETLEQCGGNRSRAAAALMIERTSLLRLIRGLGITEVPTGQRGRPPSSRKRS